MPPSGPSGQQNFFGIKVSKPGIPVQNASDNQLVVKDNFTSRIYYDQTNARMIEGQLPDGTYGMWVSKPGFDVTNTSAPGNNQLIFNSGQDIFRIVQSGAVTQTLTNTLNVVPKGTQTFTISHNLGFSPAYLVYMTTPSTFVDGVVLANLPYTTFVNDGSANQGQFFVQIYATVTSTVLNINYIHARNIDYSPGVPTFVMRYYLLQETAN